MQLDDVHRKFRGKTFPLYDDMEFIVGRDVARGDNAIGSQIPDSADVADEEDYTPLDDDTTDHEPHVTPHTSGTKRAAPTISNSVKRQRGRRDGSDGRAAELKEMLSTHIALHDKSASREYERQDIAHCKAIIGRMCPQLQGMEYVRILDMLGDAQFRDVLRSVAEEGETVFVHWLCHKLKA